MHRRILAVFSGMAVFSSPALADHMGPSSVGAGGGLTVSSPDTLDAGHGSIGLRLSYSRPQQRSGADLEALAGRVIAAHNTDYNFNASVGVAYGITHHLTVAAELPYIRRDHLREGAIGEVEQLGSVAGIGDVNLLAKYRITDGGNFGFALLGGIKAPTGSTHRRSDIGERLETEHQPGTGSWDPLFGASAGTKVGSMGLTASALYQLSTKGAQATRLGDRLQGGIALSRHFAMTADRRLDGSRNHHHGDELDEHPDVPVHSSWDAFVELGGEWEGRQKIGGETEQASGGKWVYLAPGARYNFASQWSVGGAVAVPVWQDIRASHPNNRYRLMLSLGRSF